MKIERRQKKCPVQCTILILLIHRTPLASFKMAARQNRENNLKFLSICSVLKNPQQSVASKPGVSTFHRPLQTKQLPTQVQMQSNPKVRTVPWWRRDIRTFNLQVQSLWNWTESPHVYRLSAWYHLASDSDSSEYFWSSSSRSKESMAGNSSVRCSLGYMRIFVFVLLCWCLFACLLMCPVSYPTLSVSLFRYPSDLLLTLFVSIYVIFVRALDVNMPEIRSLSPSSLFCPFLSCYSCEYLCQKYSLQGRS